MMNFDQQVDFARAMSNSLAEAASGMLDASSRMFAASPPVAEAPTSWYRPPVAANPFDWTTWIAPTSAPANPWAGFAWAPTSWLPWTNAWSQPSSGIAYTAFGASSLPFGHQPWAELASFAGGMAALQANQRAWTSTMTPAAKQPDLVAQGWEAMAWSLKQANAQLDALATVADPIDAYASYRSSSGHAVAQIVIMDDAAVQAAKQGAQPTAAKPTDSASERDNTVH